MARLFGFDYKSPYFYMVTLKTIKGVEPFSQIGPKGLIENETTKAFNTVISNFHLKWRCLDEISPFVVMPDHIHLLIKIKDVEKRNIIAKNGGNLIILSPEGFSERWHPPRIKERFCAAGRMLFLSLYPADTRKCDNATLYKRCHEMGDIVARDR